MRTPATSDRARLKAELEAMLDVIREEIEAIMPLLRSREPPETARALYRALNRMSADTCRVLFAMQDAELATIH
jgi:hypothetical protein